MRYVFAVLVFLLATSNARALCFLEDLECVAPLLLPGYTRDIPDQPPATREWSAVSGFAYGDGNRIVIRVRFDPEAVDILRSNSNFGIEIEAVLKGSNRKLDIDHTESTFPSSAKAGWDTQVLDFLTNGSGVVNYAVHVLSASALQPNVDYYVFFVFKDDLPSVGVEVITNLQITIDTNYGGFTQNLVIEALPQIDQFQYYALETDSHVSFTAYPQGKAGVCWSSKTTSAQCIVHPDQCYASLDLWKGFLWSVAGISAAQAACDVPSGGAVVPNRSGKGPGSETTATDSPQTGLPDFIVNKVWLETPGGVEQYAYDKTDEIKMNAQLKNIGDDDIPSSSYVYTRFYLSKGYKEDDHSDWIRVGQDETLGSNLDLGETHSEQEGLKLWEYSSVKPGKTYNIVACTDRTADDHNGIGDWAEKHESNNCSTEAVFTVNGSFDFTITSLSISGGKTELNPGEVFSVDATAYNGGDDSPSDTTIGYFLSGGDLPTSILIGTDSIQEGNFAHGTYKPETLSNVTAPATPGDYVITAVADHGNRVEEVDEDNNGRTFAFTVVNTNPPNPDPEPVTRQPIDSDDDDEFWLMLLLD